MSNPTGYRFSAHTCARVAQTVDREVACELWNGFCNRIGTLECADGDENRIGFGEATYLPLGEGEEYTLCVRPEGVGLQGRDAATLMRAFCALLLRIEQDTSEKDTFWVAAGEVRGAFTVSRRMIHLCVFPETDFSMLRRLARLCGLFSYTHVVLEFWGMLQYDCMQELAWGHAFSKEQIAGVIRELRAMGVEPIPMINHLGHASSCRIDSGKHVVLDQNPRLQSLFTPDGWCWNIFSPASRALLRQMRHELYELFGEGEYFHIGCDEAHIFSSEYYPMSGLCDYLSGLTAEVIAEGRRPILWGDMIVPYDTNSECPERVEAALKQEVRMRPLMSALHPQSVIADWHYDIKTSPIPSIEHFLEAGFDVVGCPWDNVANIDAQYAMAQEAQTYGLMMTTWHTLHSGMSSMLYFARKCGFPKSPWSDYTGHRNLEIATLLRKVTSEALPYAETGFSHRQTAEVISW
ncbi:MAG: family 20 glycosylhydrolase [Clostridia bacterium]|nr:family 20 glycosylhydrolase [Clostridia bacterium]MBQ9774309.1 family 20 glycosylhydrolase [Clostridia bacterium]